LNKKEKMPRFLDLSGWEWENRTKAEIKMIMFKWREACLKVSKADVTRAFLEWLASSACENTDDMEGFVVWFIRTKMLNEKQEV